MFKTCVLESSKRTSLIFSKNHVKRSRSVLRHFLGPSVHSLAPYYLYYIKVKMFKSRRVTPIYIRLRVLKYKNEFTNETSKSRVREHVHFVLRN